jgi:hypothetical protein
VEGGEAAELEPIRQDGAEEAELGEIVSWLRKVCLDVILPEKKIAGSGEPEDLSLSFTTEDAKALTLLTTERAGINGGYRVTVEKRKGAIREREDQVCRAVTRGQTGGPGKVAGDHQAKETLAALHLKCQAWDLTPQVAPLPPLKSASVNSNLDPPVSSTIDPQSCSWGLWYGFRGVTGSGSSVPERGFRAALSSLVIT